MKIQSKYMYGGKSTYRKGGHVPQTQMQRYAKAYQEGGTPDSLRNNLELYEKNFGMKLPTFSGDGAFEGDDENLFANLK